MKAIYMPKFMGAYLLDGKNLRRTYKTAKALVDASKKWGFGYDSIEVYELTKTITPEELIDISNQE